MERFSLIVLSAIVTGMMVWDCSAEVVSSFVSPYQYQREYRLLERAKEIGLVKNVDLSFKPLSRVDFAKAIVEIYNNRSLNPDIAKGVFDELYPEFKDEVDALLSSGNDENYLKPVDNIYAEFNTLSGVKKMKLPYSEGLTLENSASLRLNVSSELKYGNVLFFLEPEIKQDVLRINRAYITWSLDGLNFLFGKENVVWGNSENGDLLFTNNIRPWLMFKVENSSYKSFPWVFKKLGEYRFSTFISQLEKERARSYAHVWGMRFAWRPVYNLEIAGTRAIQFGGKGRPDYTSLHDFWELFTASKENVRSSNPEAHKYDNNQLASVDVTYYMDWLKQLKFQPFKGGKLYFVYAGDDAVKPVGPGKLPLPTAAAHIFGVSLTTGLTDVSFEYTETVDENGALWYTHHMYPDGYTYHGFVIGNAIGGDSKGFYYSIARDFDWANLKLIYNSVEHGVSFRSTKEKEHVFRLEIDKDLNLGKLFGMKIRSFRLYLRATYNSITNFDFSSESRDLYNFSLGTNLVF